MGPLKLLWSMPKVQFNGKSISEAWAEEMLLLGFDFTDDPADADCAIFTSDSQLDQELLGVLPTICYFWGWPPARWLDDPAFPAFSRHQAELMRRCNYVLVPSQNTWDQAAMLGVRSYVLPAGVDTVLLDQAPVVQRKPQVLFLSRLAEHKGLEDLIQALSLLEPRVPLVVSGPGNRQPYQELAQRLGVPVEFHEFGDTEKLVALREAAVLVHPSNYEGFGLPPLEAAYLGTPVIVRALPHMMWLMSAGACYFERPEDLAQQIARALEAPPELRQVAELAQEHVRANFTLRRAARDLANVIHEAIRDWCGQRMREHPEEAVAIYNRDHRRNWFFRAQYFDPSWKRHWRLQHVLQAVKGRSVLDVGCSAGVYSVALAQAGYLVCAYDHSPEALQQLRELAEQYHVADRIATQEGDVHRMDLDPDSYDTVWAGEILEHVADPRAALSQCVRVARQRVIASTPIGQHHDDPLHLTHWDDASIDQLLAPYRESGMEVTVTKVSEEGAEPSCYFIVIDKG